MLTDVSRYINNIIVEWKETKYRNLEQNRLLKTAVRNVFYVSSPIAYNYVDYLHFANDDLHFTDNDYNYPIILHYSPNHLNNLGKIVKEDKKVQLKRSRNREEKRQTNTQDFTRDAVLWLHNSCTFFLI